MPPPALLSPFIAVLVWLALIYLRSKNSTTTFFDVFVVCFSIGLYALFQITFYYFKGGSLADTVASKVVESFINLDPTDQIKSYLEKLQMTGDAYATKKSAIDQKNAVYTWKTPTGSLLYMSTMMGLAAISLVYHIFGEKRETVSRLAEIAITASLFLVFIVEIYLYYFVYTKFMFVHNTEVVKLSLAELKQSMSRHLVAFWNDDKNQDMRDQLRKKAELSDGVSVLIKRLQTLIEETTAISSVHGNWSKDLAADIDRKLNNLETSLGNTMNELNELMEDPSKPGAMLSNQSGKTSNLTTLNALSSSVATLAGTTTDTPDVDILLESVSQECENLIVDLDAFSRTDLFGSYRNTRDVLVELSKQCTGEDTDGDTSQPGLVKRVFGNLNTVVVVGLTLFLISLAWNKLMLQNNYRTDFCYAITTCLGLLMFQPYFIDYAQNFKTISDDFQMTLFSALHP